MLSPRTRRNLLRILPFGVIWFVSGLVFYIVEIAGAGGSFENIPGTGITMDLSIFLFGTIANVGVGLLVGVVEVLYLNKAFKRRSFSRKVIYKVLIYTGMLFLITVVTFPIAVSMELNTSLADSRVWKRLMVFLPSLSYLSTVLQILVMTLISIFYSEISDNMGQRILLNFLSGKYHKPREEKRIFMFADMRSSTTLAEQLGHIRYFELLRDYFASFTDAIVSHAGEIHEYVGDEVVISWEYEAGIRNQNCIRCFFAMQEALERRKPWFTRKYGVSPAFKAAIHLGKVTTGEIGELKKNIIFTGDVLNATARIQELCKTYAVNLLVSGTLVANLPEREGLVFKPLGEQVLRGKQQITELFTVEKTA